MFPIMLFILKLLGIVLLVLLGLILGVLLLILCVPVRYQIEGSFYDRLKGKARISWLLHIVSVTAVYEDYLSVVIRLLGFRIGKPKEKSGEDAEDMLIHVAEVADKGVDGPEIHEQARSPGEQPKAKNRPRAKNRPKAEDSLPNRKKEPADALIRKRGNIAGKISAIYAKLSFFFYSALDKCKTIKEKADEIQSWISDEDNRKVLRLLFKQVKKLARHLVPKKGSGEVVFGFDDPYTTGQVLAAVSAVYPFCHEHFSVCPVFDRQVFTAEGICAGKIRLGTLLLIAGRMMLDKNFRILLKRWLR